jgi:hypothetical protein
MAKDTPKQRPSGTSKAGAAATPVPKAPSDDEKGVRGKSGSLHHLAFRDALRRLVDSAPPNKRYKMDTPAVDSPPKKRRK